MWAALLGAAAGAFPVLNADAQGVVQAPATLGTYLDTASLYPALARLPDARVPIRVARVFRIEFDTAGQPLAPVPAVPGAMPARYRNSVLPLIQAALRPIPPRRFNMVRLLQVQTGNSPGVEEVFLPEQPASVANAGHLQNVLYESAQRIFQADTTLAGTELGVQLAMVVNENGVPSGARVVASSGREDVDAAALRVAAGIRFRPGRLDGEPAPTRIVLPIRFVFAADGP
jgi:TonB family protein